MTLFRSFAAMAVTLVGALIGVMAGQILLRRSKRRLDLPSFASVIAMMLGLGAGIDALAADHLALPRTGRGG